MEKQNNNSKIEPNFKFFKNVFNNRQLLNFNLS